jgi:hypothetical protein
VINLREHPVDWVENLTAAEWELSRAYPKDLEPIA